MKFCTQIVGVIRFLGLIRQLTRTFYAFIDAAADSEKTVSYTARRVASLVSKAVNSQPPPLTSTGGGSDLNEVASNVRMRPSL